jgi:hypothetical protein
MLPQQQGNQEGKAFIVPPAHSSGQSQAVFNPLMHPSMTFKQHQAFVQHNGFSSLLCSSVPLGIKQLQSSLPGGTTVQNYSMHMQPSQNICTDIQSPFSMQTSYVPILPGNANNDTQPEHHFELPDNHTMSASSINVSTSSYAAPQPNSPSLIRKTQNQVNFAEVPTRKLAPRSIISLQPVHFSNTAIHSSSPSLKLTNACTAMPSVIHLEQSQDKPNESALSVPNVDFPTGEQVKQRELSSYSSACEATLRAQVQRRLSSNSKNNTGNEHASIVHGTVENSSPVSAACSISGNATDKISLGKRTLPEQSNGQSGHKYIKVVGGKVSPLIKSDPDETLQQYLANLIASRGYSNQHYCSLEGGYYCQPTELQKASYGMKVIEAVRTSDEVLLSNLLDSGLSTNPCNPFGESMIHMVCRRGDHKLLQVFLDRGCSVQVSDDFGRTPLHDACWTTAPCFKSVEMLLKKDVRLLHIVDCRGSAPLSYVKRENWLEWKQFFDSQKEILWPHRDVKKEGEEGSPYLVGKAPHSLPIPDPPKAASCDDAKGISSGKIHLDDYFRRKNCDVTGLNATATGGKDENVIRPSVINLAIQ